MLCHARFGRFPDEVGAVRVRHPCWLLASLGVPPSDKVGWFFRNDVPMGPVGHGMVRSSMLCLGVSTEVLASAHAATVPQFCFSTALFQGPLPLVGPDSNAAAMPVLPASVVLAAHDSWWLFATFASL